MTATNLLDAGACIAALLLAAGLACLMDRAVRFLIREPTTARHRLAGHPGEFRSWVGQQRPAMGGLTPTRADRRRNEAILARTEGQRYRLDGQVLIRSDGR